MDIEEFCEMTYPRLARTLASYCGDAGTGADLAQEALARAWDRWDRVSEMDAPAMWVYRTGMNLARSHGRRRRRERAALARLQAREMTSASAGVEARWVDTLAVQAAIATLPVRQREAVVLRYHADLSVDAAAMVMGCAPGTVKALTHQGLAALRVQLGDLSAADTTGDPASDATREVRP